MSRATALPALHLVRLPGEFGPIVRCSGELSMATVEALRRELALLEPLAHPLLTLNVAACREMDVEAILTILDSFKRRRAAGRRLVIVAGAGFPARLLTATGVDRVIPVFPTEEAALLAVRGGGPPSPAPATWQAARDAAVARWRLIGQSLDHGSSEGLLDLLTGMTALCERAEELYQWRTEPAAARCQFCPLFHALGGTEEDIGCRSMLEPIIEAVRGIDLESARLQVAAVIRTLETLPLPQEEGLPGPELVQGITVHGRA